MRVAATIILEPSERAKLERCSRGRSSPQRLQERSQMILLAADGLTNMAIAERLGQDVGKVGRWRQRYAVHGMAGIMKDKTRKGRIQSLPASKRSEIIKLTLHAKRIRHAKAHRDGA